jgi:MacB-like periplasmic core domain
MDLPGAVERVKQDLSFGVRTLAHTPALALAIVLTLAVGIGATTAVFSILEAVLVRPLPYRQADRLVAIWDGHVREANLAKIFASYEDFEIWKAHATSFEDLAAVTWATGEQTLKGRGPARSVLAIPASVDFFRLLGVSPALGRPFQQDDLGRGCTVVLAHRFWEQALGSDTSVIGQGLTLDGRACTVAGVMPTRFEFYPTAADMWRLIVPGAETRGMNVGVFGRLKANVGAEAAQAELIALHRPASGAGNDHHRMFAPKMYRLQDEFTWLAGRNLRATLLVLFAAVAVVLLIACLNVANMLLARATGRLRLPRTEYAEVGRRAQFYERLREASARMAQVEGVALCTSLLRGRSTNFLAVEGRPQPSAETAVPDVAQDQISEGYFQMMRVPLHGGRSFDARDRAGSEPVAIVNDALVRKYFPNENPIGRRVRYGTNPKDPWLTIVGVVGNQRTMNLYQEMAWAEAPSLYRPLQQNAPASAALVLRARSDTGNVGAAIQTVIASLDPGIPVGELKSVEGEIAKNLAYPRFRATLTAGFGGLSLLLAVVGLYGVLAQVVAQRTREIGIRMALGAQQASVLALVLKQGMWIVVIGVLLGVFTANGLRRFLAAMLYDVRAGDLRIIALVIASFTLSAFLAMYLPARRAMKVNPVVALRAE